MSHVQHRNHAPSKRLSPLEMFSRLSVGQVGALYQVYKYDFEMFGYSPDEYFEAARKKDSHSRKT